MNKLLTGKRVPSDTNKNKLGQFESKYKKEYCKKAKDIMADGGSRVNVAAELEISRSTLYEWIDEYPEFKKAIEIGDTACEAWWSTAGRDNIGNPDFNTALYMIHMRNRFGWRSKDKEDKQQDNGLEAFVNAAKIIEEARKSRE